MNSNTDTETNPQKANETSISTGTQKNKEKSVLEGGVNKQFTNRQSLTDETLLQSYAFESTEVISVRVKGIVKYIYKNKLSPKTKKIVNNVIQQIIIAFASEKLPQSIINELKKQLNVELMLESNSMQYFPQLNLNLILNVNEVKAEAKSTVNIDVSKLTELLNELERVINWIETHNWKKEQNAYVIPPAVMKQVNESFSKLKMLVN